MDALIKLIIFVSMMLLGFFFGRRAERKHYQSILAREEALRHILLTSVKEPPAELQNAQLVMGSVVVASDYFKQFVAWLRSLFGGHVTSFESLLDRARREAILRMKENTQKQGANIICNVKFTTASINKDASSSSTVEAMAFGTAGYLPPSETPATDRATATA
ncbi:MAG: heavy metal-binding domain-containing protein [Burkholderiaceae bacterium]